MWLIKQDTFLWFDINKYAKIIEYKIIENWTDDNWKHYTANCNVKYYTGEAKEYEIEQLVYNVEWLRGNQLSLTSIYNWLKLLDSFNWYNDSI